MTPTVFFAVRRLFDWSDTLVAWYKAGGPEHLKNRFKNLRLPGGKD